MGTQRLKKTIKIAPVDLASTEQVKIPKNVPDKKSALLDSVKRTKRAKKTKGKKYQSVAKEIKPDQFYPLREALELLKKTSYTRFESSCEAHFNLLTKDIRGSLTLPHGTGKTQKILVFGNKTPNIKDQNITLGTEADIEKIASGKLAPGRDFNLVISTSEFMPHLSKVAKILGPKGLMPNPKAQTVSEDIEKTLEEFSRGRVEFKTEPTAPVIHLSFGKVSWDSQKLEENLKSLIDAIGKNKITKLTLSATMGPGIKVDLATV